MSKESKFIKDKDLAFLQDAHWEDLKILADALIKDYSGTEQWTGKLKSTLSKNKTLYPSSEKELYENSWKAIAAELQLFGGNTIANLTRQKGVVYKVILDDVVKKVGCDVHRQTTVEDTEEKLLRTLFGHVTKLEDLDEMYEKLNDMGLLGLTSLKSNTLSTIKKGVSGRSKLATVGVMVSRLNPLTAIISAPLAIQELSNPAYRVTIPAVCIVAMMRRKHVEKRLARNEF
ncbi:DUF3944 domain-containing protein [Psychrobacter sanguinis]|uniref:DUF3944 domain-containing protein n=1 Tax=Psychrobacter sanguinis TaxID=861445 RepID=A0A844M075_9GAMM|nr:DUF3944 domain-containing protein [Psychrobacter sanguinis]MUG32080.1 DUF3944 domain-containing protein [Psychrobacter sanguinis]